MAEHSGASAAHTQSHYVKVWGILLVLLVISVVGPMFEIPLLTLLTAFGIAVVKAVLVARNFMHLHLEKRWVVYLLVTMLVLMVLFVGGVAPDVQRHEGARWENVAAKRVVEEGMILVQPKQPEGQH